MTELPLVKRISCDEIEYFVKIAQPKVGKYQLLGDSIFVRFAKSVLNQPSKCIDGKFCNGYCVGGQRIKQLTKKIKKSTNALAANVIILIGTNDVLSGQNLPNMVRNFRKLLELLRLRKVEKIVILTLPPIPRLALLPLHWEILQGFNHFLLGLNNDLDQIRVIDIMPSFIKQNSHVISAPPKICNFVPYMPIPRLVPATNNKRRKDGLSDEGEEVLGTPKKRLRLPAVETEEDDTKLSPFCRYLNRVNRVQRAEDMISSEEDEDDFKRMQPYIDYEFWDCLRKTIKYDPKEESILFESIPESTSPAASNDRMSLKKASSPHIPSLFKSPTSNGKNDSSLILSSPSTPDVSDLYKTIIKFTQAFLRLDLFEVFFLNGQADMIHPNKKGLQTISKLLYQEWSDELD